MIQGLFVTGTDTGVGKTLVSAALLRAAAALGRSAIGMKPVAAGVEADGSQADVLALREASTVPAAADDINPYRFVPAIAPHIAAAEAGTTIRIDHLLAAFARLGRCADLVVVEGAGGLLVPLGEDIDSADLAQAIGVPLILVVGMKLGCLNHALLSVEAIQRRKLRLAGWVANRIDPEMQRPAENLSALQSRIDAPLLGEIPFGASPESAASLLKDPLASLLNRFADEPTDHSTPS